MPFRFEPALEPLFDAVAEAPDDLARWAVLADGLLEHEHIFGELIALELHRLGQPTPRGWRRSTQPIVDFWRIWQEALLGPLAELPRDFTDRLELRFGFLRRHTVSLRTLERDLQVLEAPLARLLEELRLETADEATLDFVLRALDRRVPGAPQALTLTHPLVDGHRVELDRLQALVPTAQRLSLDGWEPRGRLDTSGLTSISAFRSGDVAMLELLGTHPWPALRGLALGGAQPSDDPVAAVLAGQYPRLEVLHVAMPRLRALEALTSHPAMGRLTELHLHGRYGRADAEWLVDQRARFPALRVLRLGGPLDGGAQWPLVERRRLTERFPPLRLGH